MLKKYAILCTVCLGTLLSSYISSCTNIALPNIMQALNFNMDSIVWVSLSYLLPYGSTLPLTGKLGDQFGAKNMYIAGLAIFTAASLLCGLATSSTALIIFRIIQGIGAGMLLPNAMAIVVKTFAPHERGQSLGIWSALAATGSALGPTIGGYLIEHLDWRSIFFSVLPLCTISVALAAIIIPASSRRHHDVTDYWGAIFLISSIVTLLFALNQGNKEGWSSPYILLLLYLSFSAFIVFIMIELRVKSPMIELSLFRNVNFTIANLVAFVSLIAMSGDNFLLPFFLKSILNYTATTAGLMLLPMTVSMIVFSLVGGYLSDRLGCRIPAFVGMMIIAYSLFLLNTINPDYSVRDFSTRLILLGMGLGFTMSPLNSCAIDALPKDKVGMGAGVFNLSKIIGASVGVVLVETIFSNREPYHYQVLSGYLNAASHSSHHLSSILHTLWGSKGMDSAMISNAVHGWLTGQGFSHQQYSILKLTLLQMVLQQAAILSFEDVYYALAIIISCGGLLTMLLTQNKSGKNPAA